jgi:hypothetical protein
MIDVCASVLSLVAGAIVLPSVMGVDGRLHRPLSEAHGKPVVFIFISHDCPVCNTYAPEIGRIEAKYGQRIDVDIVYTDPAITRKGAKEHAKEFSIDRGALFLDEKSEFAVACGARLTPEAIVFDPNGRPVYSGRIDDRYRALGQQRPAATTHDLTLALDAVLSHETPKPAAGPPVGCVIILPHKT